MACTDCKQSIYNTESSIIPAPLCQGDCPEEVNCNGEVTYTDCVSSNVALPCLELSVGATQTEINQTVAAALCENPNTCNTWTELSKSNFGLYSLWRYAGDPFEKPAVSNVKGCVVRLAGTVFFNSNLAIGNNKVGTLPVGKRPSKTRRFSVNIGTTSSVVAALLSINNSGEMFLSTTTAYTNVTLSFDGISFETGTII